MRYFALLAILATSALSSLWPWPSGSTSVSTSPREMNHRAFHSPPSPPSKWSALISRLARSSAPSAYPEVRATEAFFSTQHTRPPTCSKDDPDLAWAEKLLVTHGLAMYEDPWVLKTARRLYSRHANLGTECAEAYGRHIASLREQGSYRQGLLSAANGFLGTHRRYCDKMEELRAAQAGKRERQEAWERLMHAWKVFRGVEKEAEGWSEVARNVCGMKLRG